MYNFLRSKMKILIYLFEYDLLNVFYTLTFTLSKEHLRTLVNLKKKHFN